MDTYQEVKCPFCGHKYMEHLNGEYDVEFIHEPIRLGWFGSCPMCGKFVLVVKGELDGLDYDSIPESDIKISYSLK